MDSNKISSRAAGEGSRPLVTPTPPQAPLAGRYFWLCRCNAPSLTTDIATRGPASMWLPCLRTRSARIGTWFRDPTDDAAGATLRALACPRVEGGGAIPWWRFCRREAPLSLARRSSGGQGRRRPRGLARPRICPRTDVRRHTKDLLDCRHDADRASESNTRLHDHSISTVLGETGSLRPCEKEFFHVHE